MKDSLDMTSTCIQGGYPRSVGGYQIPYQKSGPCSPIMAPLCPPGVQNTGQYMEDRSDSGINSGSEGASSSPNSDNGAERFPTPNEQNNPPSKLGYHSTPIFQRAPRTHNSNSPLTFPPNTITSHPVEVKKELVDFDEKEYDSNRNIPVSSTNPLKCLEMSFKRRLSMPPSSPVSEGEDRKSNGTSEDYEENDQTPRVNSHGKIKTFPCKQCSFVASSKLEFWKHRKTNHIKPEKLLACHLCPFNTEYKHHYEYHLRNHEGSKPFKCEHCDYTCVNKSMLNSHKKSHSNIYQYRCADCHYVSKYCHSLKMHLRKHGHQPGMVLNPDGSPNPLPIIDVYGTRRGPKIKSIHEEKGTEEAHIPKITDLLPPTNVLPLHFQQLFGQTSPMQVPLAYSFLQQAMMYQNLGRLARDEFSSQQTQVNSAEKTETMDHSASGSTEALDLTTDVKTAPSMNSDDDEEYQSSESLRYVEAVLDTEKAEENIDIKPKENEKQSSYQNFNCQYCKISFGDEVLYTMHMGYHGYQDPFTCNMCGEKCNDSISFFLHIARTPHSYNQ